MNVRIENVGKKYFKSKNKSLDLVNMTIPKGVFGLLGENGAGKTTLMKTIATILPIQEGAIYFDGQDVSKNVEKVRKDIGYLPQEFDFFESLTLYEMLDYIGILKNIETVQRENEINALIDQFNLRDKAHRKIKSLSGGMRQRVAIAQALLGDSKIVILDEPTVGLDPNERLRFRNIINEKSSDRTIIISTHIISDVAMLCDNIGIMKKGKVVFNGSIESLLEQVDGKIYVDKLNVHDNIDKSKYEKMISILRRKNTVEVRFILDRPNDLFEVVPPTLEDAYFYVIFKDEGDHV